MNIKGSEVINKLLYFFCSRQSETESLMGGQADVGLSKRKNCVIVWFVGWIWFWCVGQRQKNLSHEREKNEN